MATKTKLPKTHFKKMGYLRWRKERGLKLVATVTPMANGHKRATCVFEDKTIVAKGATHAEALDNMWAGVREALDS